MPDEAHDVIREAVLQSVNPARYATVFFPLSAILAPEFLATYIKTGSIILISEGRAGIDNTFTVHDGLLRLFLNKEAYERSGLVGKLDGTATAKRTKARWLVEIDLRLPSMQHGRKGFKRVKWAAEKVFDHSVKWLFCDMTPQGDPRPIDRYHPIWKSAEARTTLMPEAAIPPAMANFASGADGLDAAGREGVDDFAGSLYEWLSLVSLESPRITAHDSVDPFLSRYAVTGTEIAVTQTLRRIRWEGLLPAAWASELLLRTLIGLRSAASTSWFALNALGFEGGFPEAAHGYTVLRVPSAPESPEQSVTAAESSSNVGVSRDAYCLWEVVSL